jgi:N-methylhydantoinase B
MPSKIDHVKVAAGDLLIADTWGGGGCGDPLERDPAQVLFDVEAGLVSVEGARRYGVVIAHGAVDAGATKALRQQMSTKRGKVQLFDRGFVDVLELKSRCKAETGLAAPAAPQFTTWAQARAGKSDKAPRKGRRVA